MIASGAFSDALETEFGLRAAAAQTTPAAALSRGSPPAIFIEGSGFGVQGNQ